MSDVGSRGGGHAHAAVLARAVLPASNHDRAQGIGGDVDSTEVNTGRTGDPTRLVRAVLAVLGVVLLLGLVVTLDPDSPVGVGLPLLIEVGALAVLVVVAVRMPREVSPVWWAFAATLALTVVGDVVYDVQQYHFGEVPFPGWADPLYLLSYVPELLALWLLVRSRHPVRDWAQWLDSAIIAAPLCAAVAVYVLMPMIGESVDSSTLVSLAYPVLDTIVLTGLIRLLVGGGRPSRSLALLATSVGVTLIADLVYNGLYAEGLIDATPGWLNMMFSLGMVLMASAALARDAASVRHPAPDGGRIISSPRAVALGLGTLALPVLIALGVRSDVDSGVRVLATASILVNGLVVWRAVLLLGVVQKQKNDLDRVARTDSLTGLPNRRSWDHELQRAVTAAREHGTALSLAVIDLDGFKEFNDEHGHPAGDQLLVECSRRWRATLPAIAYLARFGGDEFTLLLPELDADDVRATLEMLRGCTPLPVTVSIGYARHREVDDATQTLADADAALYAAKARGRNVVVTLSETERVTS